MILKALAWLYAIYRYYWIKVNKFLFEGKAEKVSETTHKILVIGDGFAEGFGDFQLITRQPGLASRMRNLLSAERKIRQNWQVLTVGESLDCKSENWLPKSQLFKDTFTSVKYKDAEIVLLVVGMQDFAVLFQTGKIDEVLADNLVETCFENIKSIASEIASLGKRVYVCAVPVPPTVEVTDESTPLIKIPRNVKVKEVIERCNKLLSTWLSNEQIVREKLIYKGPALNTFEYHWKRNFYVSDHTAQALGNFYYFTSKGYEHFAKDFMEIVLGHLVKTELTAIAQKIR